MKKRDKKSGFPKGRYAGMAKTACRTCKVRHRVYTKTNKSACPRVDQAGRAGKR